MLLSAMVGLITSIKLNAFLLLLVNIVLPIINLLSYRAIKTRVTYLLMIDSVHDFFMCLAFLIPTFVEYPGRITFALSTVQIGLLINNMYFSMRNIFDANVANLKDMSKSYGVNILVLSFVITVISIFTAQNINGHNYIIFISHLFMDLVSKAKLIHAIRKSHKVDTNHLKLNWEYMVFDKIMAILYPIVCLFSVGIDIINPFVQQIIQSAHNPGTFNILLLYITGLAFIYASCAIPWSTIIVKALFDIDITKLGSNNPGLTNTKRVLLAHVKEAHKIPTIKPCIIFCGLMDIARAGIPMYVLHQSRIVEALSKGIMLGGEIRLFLYCLAVTAGMAGNIWSPFLGFRGGLTAACMFGIIMSSIASSPYWFMLSMTIPIFWYVSGKMLDKAQFNSTCMSVTQDRVTLSYRFATLAFHKTAFNSVLSGLFAISIMSFKFISNSKYSIDLLISIFAFTWTVATHHFKNRLLIKTF